MASNCRLQELLLVRRPLYPNAGSLLAGCAPSRSAPNARDSRTDERARTQSLAIPAPNSLLGPGQRRRYACLKCPYSTDRRDLFTRHENIHRDEKPFRCYVCNKMFNRADHVKKHFLRIHKGLDYDVKLTKRVKGVDYDVNGKSTLAILNGQNVAPPPLNDVRNNSFASQLVNQVLEAHPFLLSKVPASCLSLFSNPHQLAIAAASPPSFQNDQRTHSLKADQQAFQQKFFALTHRPNTPQQSDERNSSSSRASTGSFSDEVRRGVHHHREEDILLSSSSSWSTDTSRSSRSPSPQQRSFPVKNEFSVEKQSYQKSEWKDGGLIERDQPCFDCEFCGCAFVDYPSLHTHRYLLHRYISQDANYLPYKCVVCGDRRITQRAMIQHMLSHSHTNYAPLSRNVKHVNQPNLLDNAASSKANRRKQPQPRKIVKSELEEVGPATEPRSSTSCTSIRNAFTCKVCRKEFVTYTQHVQHQKFFKH